MLEYTWEIFSLTTAPHENGLYNVVKKVNWRFQVSDGPYYGDSYEETELSAPSSDSYIEYENLTKEIVIDWIKSNIDYDSLVSSVIQKLESNRTPELVEMKPSWNNTTNITGSEEYILVIDDEITNTSKISAPFHWDYVLINKMLEEFGFNNINIPDNITAYRKNLVPSENPLLLNEHVKIYRVIYDNEPVYDEITQCKRGPYWSINSGKVFGEYVIEDRPIDEIKATLKTIIGIKKTQSLLEPSEVLVNEKLVKTYKDAQTYSVMKCKADSMQESDNILWKLVDSWITVNKTELYKICSFIENEIQTAFDQEYDNYQQIEICQTVEQLREFYNSNLR